MTARGRGKGVRRRLGLCLFATLFSLVLAELALRVMGLPPSDTRPPKHLGKQLPWVRQDPTTGWMNRAGYSGRHRQTNDFDVAVRINALGLRDSECGYEKSPGRKRILVVGDSFTFGHGVEAEQTYPAQLQALLADTEVLNGGVQGMGHDQQLLWFKEQGLKFAPDLVIWGFSSADIPRNTVYFRRLADPRTGLDYGKPRYVLEDGRLTLTNVPTPEPDAVEAAMAEHLAARRRAQSGMRRALSRARVLSLVFMAFDRLRERREQLALAHAIAVEFVRTARTAGVDVLIVHLPVRKWLVRNDPVVRLKRHTTDKMLARVSGECRVPTVDLRAAFLEARKGDVEGLFIKDGHYSPAGHAVIAGRLAAYLTQNGKAQPARSPSGVEDADPPAPRLPNATGSSGRRGSRPSTGYAQKHSS